MQNLIINEGYKKDVDLFYGAQGKKIFTKNKKYIDLSMCAGSILLGHNHKVFQKSIKKFISKKISNIAAPNINAEIFAKNIKKVVPNSEKIIFCNSGTEAVMKSLRLARALNNKKKIAYVTGGWHGSVDQLLYKANKKLKPVKLSSGLPEETYKNLILIPYNDFEKSEFILKKNKNKISCLIIEPIQACLPYENVGKYLKFLEVFCKKNNIILIFDECTSAFRENFGGLHLKYKIQPDLAMFGKALGNGYPITSIIGKKSIMETLSDSFVSSTFWSDRIGPTAGLASLKEMENQKSWEILLNLGYYFRKKIKNFDQKDLIEINKEGIIPNISLKLNPLKTNKKNLISFFLKNNIITSDRIYLSTAHTKINSNKYFEVLEKFLDLVKKQKHFLI